MNLAYIYISLISSDVVIGDGLVISRSNTCLKHL